MTTTLTVDKAGRVVIPKSVRDELHLEAGDSLELESSSEGVVLRPVRSDEGISRHIGNGRYFAGGIIRIMSAACLCLLD